MLDDRECMDATEEGRLYGRPPFQNPWGSDLLFSNFPPFSLFPNIRESGVVNLGVTRSFMQFRGLSSVFELDPGRLGKQA